ncbi:hypothetical protein RS9916_32012 [Synechococcus sp. RS9916]|nr:hypothetical protein RS9916_32012 [Synechococcus sp. RS9916]
MVGMQESSGDVLVNGSGTSRSLVYGTTPPAGRQ